MYGQYSSAVYIQERVMMARVQYPELVTKLKWSGYGLIPNVQSHEFLSGRNCRCVNTSQKKSPEVPEIESWCNL